MNREDVIRMAREADEGHAGMECEQFGGGIVSVSTLERFAALVAAAEREECARVVDAKEKSIYLWTNTTYLIECAEAIRARGNQ